MMIAEMNLGENPDARAWILLGDGQGAFRTTVALEGFDTKLRSNKYNNNC